jgi:hypothetical protein
LFDMSFILASHKTDGISCQVAITDFRNQAHANRQRAIEIY